MENVPRTHEDIEAQIREIQSKKKDVQEEISDKGVKLGESGYFDMDIYETGKGKYEGYVTSIAANDEVDDDEEDLGYGQKRTGLGAPVALLNDVAQSEKEYDPFADRRRPTIADREDEYRQKRRRMIISPERVDPFADGGKTPDFQARNYSQIMKEQLLKGEENEVRKKLVEKSKDGSLKVINGDVKPTIKKRGRWDQTVDEALPPQKKKALSVSTSSNAATPVWEGDKTPADIRWDETPGHKGSETPGATPGQSTRIWDATPGAATPGRDTTPGHSGDKSTSRRNRWDETPKTERETPGHSSGWAETPRTDRTGADLIQETPTPGASKRRSRWDETPSATPSQAMTPGAMTPTTPHGTPSHATPMLTPGGSTPVGVKAMAMATPTPGQLASMTPEQLQAYRWEREIDERNRPYSDDELDSMFPPGYKVLPPPAGYIPIRTPSRKLTATPTPMIGGTPQGFFIQQEDRSAKYLDNQPKGQNVPFMKPEDAQYFDKLLVDVDEEALSPEEQKERKIMKLLLKIKNGTRPMRKAALRQITDKAREFGAGPLFNQILLFLMSPTLEDQERHLLVKVIDRILYKLDDLVRPYVHKILVVIEPLLIDEDYYARVEGREIISNLAKAAGLATMISTMRPDIDNIDEYVRNTTARAFAVVASALGIPSLLPFLKAVCRSKKSWQARHTGIKIVQQIAILMGCAILPHLKSLVEIIEHGLVDEQQKVRTITALGIAALAEAATPYGIKSFDSVLKPLWKGIRTHRGKGLAAFLKAIGYLIPLMDAEYANYYTREVMLILIREFQSPDEEMKKIVLKVVKQCCSTDGVEPQYIKEDILPQFFKHFWNHRMALDRRNYRQLVDTTVEIANKVGASEILNRIVDDLKDENEQYRKMVMESIEKIMGNLGAADIDSTLEEHLNAAAENGHANIIELLAFKFKASILERTKDGSTLMHIASLNGHADCATMLFKKGVYLHMPNKDGARSIHTAARYGHVGIINTLLQKGEKVDVTTNDNYTALHIAVESCRPAVVETLLGYGADVHVRGGKLKETALHIAARVKDGEKCALMLLKSGAGPNLATYDGQTPVHVAARYGNLPTLLLLLEDGGDPQFKNKKGETPLHLASRDCRPDVVQHLINYIKDHKGENKAAAYVNEVNDNDETALHYVCAVPKNEVEMPNADREVVKLLLENGADVKLQTKQHESAFHYVVLAGNNDVLMEMISHMSPTDSQRALNRQNASGWTSLLIASRKGHIDLVNNLLGNHARLDVFDLEGRSALHLAAEQGYLQVCDSLLTHKAFINSKSRNGRTALHLAAMNGYIHLVQFLIKDHNAVIDILTLKKQTPLHLAAGAGQIEVCKLLLELGADIDATDEDGQKPIHDACQNNHSEVAKLFLQQHPSLVMATTKDGNTCAHIAAAKGSVTVIEELMKFDRQGVISSRNKLTDATPLQIAAEGGHAEVVKASVRAGANITDENRGGFTAVHLAAQYGHMQVLEVLRSSNSLRIISKKLGVTPLHVAAYFGQADTVRELLTHVPGTVKSDPPNGTSLVPTLGNESGMTPLHLASFSGNENVVRLLLNSAGVQVDAATHENGYNSMHLACYGGHSTVVGLLLSRSAELLQSHDKHGKTGLHIAAQHGHYQMVEVLLGQGAEINAPDKNGWTPLHCAARAGCFEVVKLLVESGASPKSETNLGAAPIWFAASEGHHAVLEYLMTKEHDTYALMEDRRFVNNLMVCSKNHDNKPIKEFILVSPAPVDTAAKLSNILIVLSNKEKERAKDLIAAGKFCEGMATELLALAAGADSAGKILTATDRRNIEFLDVLIENEQKEVIAHTVVQRYLQELWRGALNWAAWRTLLLFVFFIICPPVWIAFTLPLGHKYYKVPIIKFMSYLTSHVYLMLFLLVVGITPPYPVVRKTLIPYWYEWILLIWLSELLLFELTNPSDKSGLGWIKISVLLFSIFGVGVHLLGFLFIEKTYWPTLMYCRNQLFALSFVLACVQILDFLSFHHLFGPWAIIIGNLMKDLARFLAVLAIFVFGFSMQFVALNQPFHNLSKDELLRLNKQGVLERGYFVAGVSFTKYCKEMCEELNLGGWVKNTKKGTIQGKLQGYRSNVQNMVTWLSITGSPGSKIDHCELANWQNLAKPDYQGFQIRF